jgi:hypothetical protein
LTCNEIIEIYRLKESCQPSRLGASVARKFGVTPKAIRDIWKLKTWSDLTTVYATADLIENDAEAAQNDAGSRKRPSCTPGLAVQNQSHKGLRDSIGAVELPPCTESKHSALSFPVPCPQPLRFIPVGHQHINALAKRRKASVSTSSMACAPPTPSYADIAMLPGRSEPTPAPPPPATPTATPTAVPQAAGPDEWDGEWEVPCNGYGVRPLFPCSEEERSGEDDAEWEGAGEAWRRQAQRQVSFRSAPPVSILRDDRDCFLAPRFGSLPAPITVSDAQRVSAAAVGEQAVQGSGGWA